MAEVYQLFCHPILVVGFKLPRKLQNCFPPGITGLRDSLTGAPGMRSWGSPETSWRWLWERAAAPCTALLGAPAHKIVSCLYEQYPKLTEALCLSRKSGYSCAWICWNKQHGGFHPSISTGGLGNLTLDLLTQLPFVGTKFPSSQGRIGRRLLVSMNSAPLPHQPPLCCYCERRQFGSKWLMGFFKKKIKFSLISGYWDYTWG